MSALLSRVRDVRVHRSPSGWIALRSTEAPEPGCPTGMLIFVDAVQLSAPGGPAGSAPAVAGGETAPDRAQRTGRLATARGAAQGAPRQAFRWVGPTARDLVPVVTGPSDVPGNAGGEPGHANVDRVRMSSVVAVEVYPAVAGVPPEFLLPGAECGVVLIWTGN
jgi:hypothetical protein